ncbi:BRCA1 C Terminus domain containing protein expressed [Zea mays]|nr:BRCA1 C Terminus domain containing protein expressed [Zea mays]ONM10725.1 BRCA1 C Terminus domain containing protein expressed [Zea mays]ONM10727.1 BRCA1 C Terminus domain containing protein expressed [Zea mays]
MSICGYHSPRFSEDITWLPQWLQPYSTPVVGEHRNNSTAVSSLSCQNCAFVGHPSQEHQDCQNATDGYSGFILHLSGDEDTVVSSPVSSNVLPFSLRVSSESAAQPSLAEGSGNPQIPNSGTCNGLSESLCADGEEQEVNAVSQNQFEANDPQVDMPTKVARKEISIQPDTIRHRRHGFNGGKVDVRKLRNVDVNDAIELSIAASEAMVIAEMILDDSQPDKSAAAAIEAALHVKEARKQFYFEEPQHACGSSEGGLDEIDWLAELDESEMVDAYQDVALSLIHIACSSQDHNTGDLKQQNSHPTCPPCDADTHILWDSSSERQNKKWNSQNADSDDHVSDSFPNNQSAGVPPNEPTPCSASVKQAALCKTISCSRNKKTVLQASTQNNAAFHGTLGALATYQNVHKKVAGVAAQTNVGMKKRVKGLFEEENSYISDSISTDRRCPTSRASSMEIVASSRASLYCKAEGLLEENHHPGTEELCCQVVCSSLSQVDPLCSIVPCSISCDEGPSSQAPVCKQSEGHEGPSNQAPSCKKNEGNEGPTCLTPEREHSKKKEEEFMHTKEFPMMQYLDEEAGPSCVPLVKPADSNVPFRRRKYSSLRPFSTIATKSNIFGSTSNSNADVPVCQLERFTPIVLNKNVQRVQAAKEFIENSAGAENLEDFSAVRKQTYYPQDGSEDQIRELQVPREVFPPTENLVVKQHLKRKRVQFSEAKRSSRRTKNNRRILTKSRFSRSDSRTGEMLETREYTDNKEDTFQGVEFLLTGFPKQKEKEIESLIRKSGGYVLSKVSPFPLDKRKNMAEFPSWNPPIVLSPKKVSTAKFLYGCAIDAWILNPIWLFDSLQAGIMLPPGK